MGRSIPSLATFLLMGGVFLFQTGCTVKWVSHTPPPQPIRYPNAERIEARALDQIDWIESALQERRIHPYAADALADNDETVLEMVHEFQASRRPIRDLNLSETRYLDAFLDDNAEAIEDAIRRRAAWGAFFRRRAAYDFRQANDRYLYSAHLDHELRRQRERIAEGRRSGRLGDAQARELEDRVQVIVNVRVGYYKANQRMVLTEPQIRELDRMTRDNDDCLEYRLKGGKNPWNKDKSSHWKGFETRDRGADFKRIGWDEKSSRSTEKRISRPKAAVPPAKKKPEVRDDRPGPKDRPGRDRMERGQDQERNDGKDEGPGRRPKPEGEETRDKGGDKKGPKGRPDHDAPGKKGEKPREFPGKGADDDKKDKGRETGKKGTERPAGKDGVQKEKFHELKEFDDLLEEHRKGLRGTQEPLKKATLPFLEKRLEALKKKAKEHSEANGGKGLTEEQMEQLRKELKAIRW